MQYRQCIQTTSKYGEKNSYYSISKIIANTKKLEVKFRYFQSIYTVNYGPWETDTQMLRSYSRPTY